MQRIVFFSKDDLASYPMMNNINEYLENDNYKKSSQTINYILELHHICEYIDNGFLHQSWNDAKIQQYKALVKDFKRDINLYYNTLSPQQIVDFYDDIDFNYSESFWLLINRFKIYKKIQSDILKQLFKKDRFNIDDILYCSNVVLFFEAEIRDYLLSAEDTAENLLNYYEAVHDRERKEKFFPKSFTIIDKENVINRYLDSSNVNLNYIRLIEKNKDTESVKISDKTRLKAKRLSKKLNDEFLESENVTVVRRGVCLSKDQEEVVKVIVQDGRQITSYSEKRLLQKTDKITLFKNFKTVFGLIDFQGCIDLVSKSGQIDTLEKILMRSKNEFLISAYFYDKSLISRLKFEAYKIFLEAIDLKSEDLLQYYVNDYINNKYKAASFRLYIPTLSGTTLEKIRLLVPEFESLIEQYKLFVQDGSIDFELLQVTTKTSGFEKIPSLIKKKYVYPKGDEYLSLSYNFFTKTSFLFDYKKYGKKYRCFYQIIVSENITLDDFEDHQRKHLQRFIDAQYLKIDQNNFIKPVSENFFIVIGILHTHDVLNYWYFPVNIRSEIDKMEQQQIISFSGALFSKAEQDYFNFYLNNRFSNGLWLRNKYVHATNSHDGEEQKNDYDILLKLLVLLVLKIEEDLNISANRF